MGFERASIIAVGLFVCSCGKVGSEIARARLFDGGFVEDAGGRTSESGSAGDGPRFIPDPMDTGIERDSRPRHLLRCESVDPCPGRFARVSVPVSTPIFNVVFDHAWLEYGIGFSITTGIALTVGELRSSLPSVTIVAHGNPISDPGASGAGDHEVTLFLQTCDSQYLETKGTLHVNSHEAASAADGGYSVRLDASVLATSEGWHVDSRFLLTDLCGVSRSH